MFKNYFKTAWRNLLKNKVFSLINIAGLSVGMAACLLILQYVSFELSFDQFNKNAPDLYRVVNDRYQNGKLVQHGTITYSSISVAMKKDYPEVIDACRVEPMGTPIISYKDKKFGDINGLAAENSFLSMFNYPLLAGNAGTALKEPNSIVLSEKAVQKIFGVRNNYASIIGQAVILQRDSMPYLITGVCSNVPENSHLDFDFLVSYVSLYSGNGRWKQAEYDFTKSDFWHYIRLRPGTNYKALEAKLPAFSQKYFKGNKVSGSDEKFYLQPLSKAHLYSDFEYEIGKTGSATVVWGLLIIALFIIVIAWVNYINLSTAKSMERAKEVGIRKVSGATKNGLVRQFLTESLLINIIALLVAVLIVVLVQNSFNNLIKHNLSLSYLFQKGLSGYNIIAFLVALIVTGILVSGFYPAFVLSSFKPISVLKGKFVTSAKGIVLRKVLVVGQFAVTVALIIGSIVVQKQIQFVSKQDLGMNMDQILIVNGPRLSTFDSAYMNRVNSFKEELKRLPHIKGATNTDRPFGNELARAFNVHRTDDNSGRTVAMRNLGASYDFLDVYGIKLLTGRNFSQADYNPNWKKLHSVVINSSAVKLLGFTSNNDAIGKSIMVFNKKWDVIGVINDFHHKSLRYAIEPLILLPAYDTDDAISVKVDTKDLPATIASIKKKYDEFFPGNLFDYFFLDERFNAQYNDDQLFGKVFTLFAGFAIFIACLGLLGLSLFATTQRTKEIGVRKVLGASVSSIVALLSKEFVKLILIAFVIATPVAWYIMHQWLQHYAYRIGISWWIFAGAGLLALIIALATISFQAVKAALANPVKSLKTE
jgi:putative ABC transport system permease protein